MNYFRQLFWKFVLTNELIPSALLKVCPDQWTNSISSFESMSWPMNYFRQLFWKYVLTIDLIPSLTWKASPDQSTREISEYLFNSCHFRIYEINFPLYLLARTNINRYFSAETWDRHQKPPCQANAIKGTLGINLIRPQNQRKIIIRNAHLMSKLRPTKTCQNLLEKVLEIRPSISNPPDEAQIRVKEF